MRRSLVLPLLLLAALVLLPPAPAARAQDGAAPPGQPGQSGPHASSTVVKKELTGIIDAQLAAFRAGDYAKAYGFAASAVKEVFPPDNFATMVKTGYPVIAHSARADYGLAFDTGEEAVINVRIEDGAKKSAEFQYLLKKEGGGWKISGVSELKSTDLTV